MAADQRIAAKWRSAGDIRRLGRLGLLLLRTWLAGGATSASGGCSRTCRGCAIITRCWSSRDGRAEIAATLSRYTTVTDPSLYARMALPNFSTNGDLDLAVLEEQRRWHVEHGSASAAVALSQAVDTSFAELAVRQLGRVADNMGRVSGGRPP